MKVVRGGIVIAMLQAWVNELNSGIIIVKGEYVYILGFFNTDRLHFYETIGKDNSCSKSRYKYKKIEFHDIKSGATIVLEEDGKEMGRYQFLSILRDTLNYVDENDEARAMTFEIRKSTYSSHYNFRAKSQSLLFEDILAVSSFLLETYNYKLDIE